MAYAAILVGAMLVGLYAEHRVKALRRNRYLPRWQIALRQWVRQRNEAKLKRSMGWRSGWSR